MTLRRTPTDGSQRMRVVDAWTTGRLHFNVVGESRYHKELRQIVARVGGGTGGEAVTRAVLRPEPDNVYDRNAVQVAVDDLVVGYLPAEDAANYSALLTRLASQGVLVSVPARVWWDAAEEFMASVRLDLAPPGLLLPVNAAPTGEVLQLPPGNAMQVTGEDAHLQVLAPFVADTGQVAVLATLHEVSEQKARTVKQVVEVRVDGARVGQLTAGMSEHLLAVIRRAAAAGVGLCCRASIRGNHLKAEVTIYPTKAADLPTAWIADLESRLGTTSVDVNGRAVELRGDIETVRAGEAPRLPPADWYPNPTGPGLRWWDGQYWTEHVHSQ